MIQLHIDSADEVVAFQRIMNLSFSMERNSVRNVEGMTFDLWFREEELSYFLSLEIDDKKKIEWQLPEPPSWENMRHKPIKLGEREFIAEFNEFVEDYSEND